MFRKRWRWAALVLLLTAAPLLRADEEYDKLLEHFNTAQQKWFEQVQKLGEDERQPPNPADEFVPKFRAYAEEHAGQPEAIPALAWIVQAVRPSGTGQEPPKDVRWALEQLAGQATAPAMKDALQGLRSAVYSWGAKPLLPLFEKVYQEHPNTEAKAEALFSRGFALYSDLPSDVADRPAAQKKAVEVFRAVLKEFPNSETAGKAEPFLFEAEHLQVGMKAPDFAGEDEHGQPVKLADFKGRVVVIDYWGYW